MPNAQPTSSDSAHSVRTASDTGEQPGNRTPIGDSQPASSYHSGNPPTTSDHSTKGNNASSTPVDGHSADRPPDSISRSAASTSSTEQLLSPRVVTVINGSLFHHPTTYSK